jgi:hypothetical protein
MAGTDGGEVRGDVPFFDVQASFKRPAQSYVKHWLSLLVPS